MMAAALVLAAAAQSLASAGETPRSLSWTGSAEVYIEGKPLALTVRTRIDSSDNVVSESWPTALGEEKGMHRLVLTADGGTMQIGAKTSPAPPALLAEERKQFGFYRQLQEAGRRAPEVARSGANTFSVPGPVRTWFRIDKHGNILSAQNILPGDKAGSQIAQTFKFDGWWRRDGAIFPRRMEMLRSGQPYFTLVVTRFDAE